MRSLDDHDGPCSDGMRRMEKMDICHQRGPSLRIFFSHVFFFLPYRTPLWTNFSFYRTLSETPKRSSSRRTSRIRIVSEQAFPAVSLQRDGKNQDGESGWIQMHSGRSAYLALILGRSWTCELCMIHRNDGVVQLRACANSNN